MRHLKSGRQLGRNSSHRKAMFRNMVVSLLDHESITTTDAKAKELRRHVEKVITLGKRGTLASRRMARVIINDRAVLQKLFSTIAERYKERPGGYTRIVKIGVRPGDSAPMSVIQLVQEELSTDSKPSRKAPEKASVTITDKPVEEAIDSKVAEEPSVAEAVEAKQTDEGVEVEAEAKGEEAPETETKAEEKK
ncbi:MAG: 50S ribosomal protein L17 [bacterium]|nr:50S ribosomal protein L17 [bacterium]